jgi:hypothetical protein
MGQRRRARPADGPNVRAGDCPGRNAETIRYALPPALALAIRNRFC